MKKSLLALAVLGAFAASAQAQTSVTIYGSFDAGVRYNNNANAAGDSNTTMGSNGHYNTNRLGFRGVEDLGGGMNAHFTLETGFNSGTGQLDNAGQQLFQRSAFVGLGGSWGSLDLGRQYSVNFKTIGMYDPFSYKFVTIIPLSPLAGLTRLNNDIQYTGAFGPVTVRAEYALGEVAGENQGGRTAALGAGFVTGPFSVGGAYTNRTNPLDNADQDVWTVGGAFATGPFRVAAGYAKDKREAGFSATNVGQTAAAPNLIALVGAETEFKDAWLGGSYNITPAMALQAGYYQTKQEAAGADGKRKLAIIGMTYNLSKRTNFYTEVDHAKFSGTYTGFGRSPSTDDTTTGFSVGINHLF